jgi:glycine hydroxymethyltransferase
MSPEFADYQLQVVKNARAMSDAFIARGLVPVSGGTDTHLLLMDLSGLGITGKEAQHRLDEVNITSNKNMIPYDKQKNTVTSGIRLGTPAVTTRGMKEPEMEIIAGLIYDVLCNDEPDTRRRVIDSVEELTNKFPLY